MGKRNKRNGSSINMKRTLFIILMMIGSIYASTNVLAEPTSGVISQNTMVEEYVQEQAIQDNADDILAPETGTIAYRGKDGNLDWSIDVGGHLTISGIGDYTGGETLTMSGWRLYSDQVKTATVQVTGITSTAYMFYGCSNLTRVDLSQLDTSLVVYMGGMFSGCANLKSIDVSHFDTSIVKDMSFMFSDCSSLESLNLSNFDTGLVTNMSSMFYGCSSLEDLNISNIDTGNVTGMSCMFAGCSNLKTLDVSCFYTGNVTNMSYMFRDCRNLETLDVSNFDTRNVINMHGMFGDCRKLTALDLSHFDAGVVSDAEYMLVNCENMIEINAPKNLQVTLDFPASNIPGKYNFCWYDMSGNEYSKIKSGETTSIFYSKKTQWITEDNTRIFLDEEYILLEKEVKPVPHVSYRDANFMKEGIDFQISYENNKKTGTATITIIGIGYYKGTLTRQFSVVDGMGDLKNCNFDFVYGKNNSKKGKDVCSLRLNIRMLKPATDYTVELSDYKGNLLKTMKFSVGEKRSNQLRTFKNLSADVYGVRIRAGKGSKLGKWSHRVYVIKQPKAQARADRGKIQIEWQTLTGVNGYEIYMSKKKDGEYTKVATVGKDTTQKEIEKLNKKKLGKGTYFYYVLAKKKAGGRVYRSKVGTTYKVRIK